MEIDCRGKACPEPVIMTKEALERLKEGTLTVIVDDPSSCENIVRFVQSQGCSIRTERIGEEFHLHVKKGEGKEVEKPQGKAKKFEGRLQPPKAELNQGRLRGMTPKQIAAEYANRVQEGFRRAVPSKIRPMTG